MWRGRSRNILARKSGRCRWQMKQCWGSSGWIGSQVNHPRLSGKAAIVTGGSHGIGAATCKALAREGAAVAVTDVLDDDGRMIAEHINSTGGNARFWHLDVTDEAAVEHVLGEVANAFGKIDVVVNNAGIAGVSKPTHEITIEEWEHVLKIAL